MFSLQDGEIPSVGKVDLAWIQTPLPPVNLATKSSFKNENAEDTAMDEGDAMASTSSPAPLGHGHEQQDNIDYDVADDNDWGQIQ